MEGRKKLLARIDELGMTTGEGLLAVIEDRLHVGVSVYHKVFLELTQLALSWAEEEGLEEAAKAHNQISLEALLEVSNDYFHGELSAEIETAISKLK